MTSPPWRVHPEMSMMSGAEAASAYELGNAGTGVRIQDPGDTKAKGYKKESQKIILTSPSISELLKHIYVLIL